MVAAGQSGVSEEHGQGAVPLPGPRVSQTAFPHGPRQAGEGMGLHLLGLCLPPPKLAEHWQLSRCDPGRCSGVIPAALRCSAHRGDQQRPRPDGPGPARYRAPPIPGRPGRLSTGPGPRGPLPAPRGKDAVERKGKGGNRSVPEAPGAGWSRMARPGLTSADGASTAGPLQRGRGFARKRLWDMRPVLAGPCGAAAAERGPRAPARPCGAQTAAPAG